MGQAVQRARRLETQSTTSGGAPKKRRCISWSRNTSRPSWRKSRPRPARAYRSLSKTSSMPFSNAASSPTVFCACAARECAHEKLVAFSCKRRGFCPSCGARRMAETAAHLVDSRHPARCRCANGCSRFRSRCASCSPPIPICSHRVLQCIHRVIAAFLIKQAGLKRSQAHTGAVTLIQRFGSAANLNIHLHCLVLDGVYRTAARARRCSTRRALPASMSYRPYSAKIITAHPAAIDPPQATSSKSKA